MGLLVFCMSRHGEMGVHKGFFNWIGRRLLKVGLTCLEHEVNYSSIAFIQLLTLGNAFVTVYIGGLCYKPD